MHLCRFLFFYVSYIIYNEQVLVKFFQQHVLIYNFKTIFADGVQLFLLPVVLGPSLLALGVSNTLFALAFGWYFYITHLGYRALPFLSNTEVFLFPIAAVLILYIYFE